MSPYGGWGCFKIVIPAKSEEKRNLVGGLKNAIERGETLQRAAQSFINAGYTQSEVSIAIQKLNNTASLSTIQQPSRQAPISAIKPLPTTQLQNKKFSKTLIIVLVVVSAIVLAGAAVLGIFWNSLF